MAVRGAGFPWIAVGLAVAFGFYGLVRKKLDINSLHGPTIESAILLPIALLFLSFAPSEKISAGTWGLLSLSGIFLFGVLAQMAGRLIGLGVGFAWLMSSKRRVAATPKIERCNQALDERRSLPAAAPGK